MQKNLKHGKGKDSAEKDCSDSMRNGIAGRKGILKILLAGRFPL